METTPRGKKAMTRDEVMLFINLVNSYDVLTSKETNASTNKLKEEAWETVTTEFNEMRGSVPRKKEQLKLKWDNLKKAARKRNQQIQINKLKGDDGKPDFNTPDEMLDKVACMIQVTDNDELPDQSEEKKRSVEGRLLSSRAKLLYGMPSMVKSIQNMGRKRNNDSKVMYDDDGSRKKNLAIANYYNKMAEKVELEIILLKQQIENKED